VKQTQKENQMDKNQIVTKDTTKKIIEIDDSQVWGYLRKLVRGSVEETLNGLRDAEADRLCGAKRYERSPDRVDSRALRILLRHYGVHASARER
jgi:hypothetical protein